jgi:hypothetical protein
MDGWMDGGQVQDAHFLSFFFYPVIKAFQAAVP